MNRARSGLLCKLIGLLSCAWLAACGDPPAEESVSIGVLLSYSGFQAANSISSERALLLVVEAANAAGGIGGRKLRLLARDTRSDPSKVGGPARELIEAGAVAFIGPDTNDLVNQLRGLLEGRTVVLPSFNTASIDFKPNSWFVMGPGTARVACELVGQLRTKGRQNPVVVLNPSGYNSLLSWELTNKYGLPKYVLPTDRAATASSVRPLAELGADAFVLAAFPTSASPLIHAMSAIGALGEPSRWFLSPTLHTPAFFESIPRGVLEGAHGVSAATAAGASDFRARFFERWHDAPLDDAYSFYDAGAVTVLALQRAFVRQGNIPTGIELGQHLLAVTSSGGVPVQWHELSKGFSLLTGGQEVRYGGLSGQIEFDLSGQTRTVGTNWWTIGPNGFVDVPSQSDCK